jgi:hypothetical protein
LPLQFFRQLPEKGIFFTYKNRKEKINGNYDLLISFNKKMKNAIHFSESLENWQSPDFQKSVRQKILSTLSKDAKKRLADLKVPALTYNKSPIPNYEKRLPAPKFQNPLSPEESMKFIQVPIGFKLELFASEPMIKNPIYMNWDHQGRLWVIETIDYPNQINPDAKGRDKIKILEDTNKDGKADKVTICAEGLNIPTSFTFWKKGIILSMAPKFYFLEDKDGDDKADSIEVTSTGWSQGDTHAGPSNLRYGLDNKIWGCVAIQVIATPQAINPSLWDYLISALKNGTWSLLPR